jgi:hypothetical protein
MERWRQARGAVSSMMEWIDSLDQLADLTGSPWPELPGRDGRSLSLVRRLRMTMAGRRDRPDGFEAAIFSLVLVAVLAGSTRRTRQMLETAAMYGTQVSYFKAATSLVVDTPSEWRRAFALGTGPAFIAELPEQERDQLIAQTRRWLSDHPMQAKELDQGTSISDSDRPNESSA